MRLARGNGGPATLRPQPGGDGAGRCLLFAHPLGGSPAAHSLSASLLVGVAAEGWARRYSYGAWGLAADEGRGGALLWSGFAHLSVGELRGVIG